MFQQKPIHYPNLKTVLMVESFLQEQRKPVSRNAILNNLPKKTMRQTLNIVLEYLELSNKVYISDQGVEWVFDEGAKLKTLLKKAASSI